MPASVDSCAIAGMVDLLRTQGSFGLSARFVIALGLSTSRLKLFDHEVFPPRSHFEAIGCVFDQALNETTQSASFVSIALSNQQRSALASAVEEKLSNQIFELIKPLQAWIKADAESGSSLYHFCLKTVDAFLDNDLFLTTKTFLKAAKGSFGLSVASSLDADHQLCFAARGQTMSLAFYPKKGLVCYGSEQLAVKAGLNFDFPGSTKDLLDHGGSVGDLDNHDALRLDLDDVAGEVCLLDWGRSKCHIVSRPSRFLACHTLMNGSIQVILDHENNETTTQNPQIYHRMTRLTRNIKQVEREVMDPILSDITDIAHICSNIQKGFRAKRATSSTNRLSAFNLSRCLRQRLDARLEGTVHPLGIDVLVTGCEVSLWLGEQFASDLQKSFPNLRIKATNSS